MGGAGVERVQTGSGAAQKGLRQGVVVFRADEREVRAPADVQAAVARQERCDSILIGVRVDRRAAFPTPKLKS